MPVRILFLCTGNSCRSQIAEGWARHFSQGRLTVASAGTSAQGVNPRAVAVMREAGLDISAQISSTLTDAMLAATDYLVTVCGHADESCPAVSARIGREHWPLDDPARATGTEAEIMTVFRSSRDDIGRRVEDLLARLAAQERARE